MKRMKFLCREITRLGMMLLLAVAVLWTVKPVNAVAATQAENAKKAYKSLLSKPVEWEGSYKDPSVLKFGLLDLNNDQIPELYVYTTKWDYNCDYKLYGYVDGKAKCLYSFRRYSKMSKFYPSIGVFVYDGNFNRGVEERIYFKYDGRKVVQKARSCVTELYNSYIYESTAGNTVSKAKYNDIAKKLLGKASSKSAPVLYKNNATNRNKYLNTMQSDQKIYLNKNSVGVKVGKTISLKLMGASGTVKWSSNDKKIATVTSKGVVKGKGVGTTYITAKYKGKTYKCKIKVNSYFKQVCLYAFSNGGFYFQVHSVSGNTLTYSVNMPYMRGEYMTADITSDGKNAVGQYTCNVTDRIHTLKITIVSGGIRLTETSNCTAMLLASQTSQNSQKTLTHTFYPESYFYE